MEIFQRSSYLKSLYLLNVSPSNGELSFSIFSLKDDIKETLKYKFTMDHGIEIL